MADKILSDPELLAVLPTFVAETQETIFITDAEWDAADGPHILYANAAIETVSGYAAEPLIGQRLSALYRGDTLLRLIDQMRDAVQTRRQVAVEVPAITKADKPYWMEISTVVILSDAGMPTHFVWRGENITQRKRSETERETTQRLVASIFGVLDHALAVIDDQGRFAMLNTAVTRQFGWSVFDLVGKPFTEIIDPAERPGVEHQLAEAQEMTCRLPVRLRHRNGDLAPGEIVVTTIPQADGKPSRVMMLVQHSPAPVDNSFEHAVRRALDGAGQQSTVVAGKVQLQGLDEIRATAGGRWLELSDRVFDMAESILRDHLGPADVFSRTTDDGFLVCFVELNETEAKTRARAIATEMREKLVAEFPDLAETEVSDFVTNVEVDAADVMPENAIANALEARLTRERKRLEDIAFKTMRATLTTAEVVFQSVRSERDQPVPILMTRLQPHVEAAQASLLALGRSEYVPKTEALMLSGAIERVQAELAEVRQDMILTPIRLTALIHKRDSDHWLSIARGVDGEARKRLMVEVRELSRDTPRARLSEVTMLISSLFRGIAFELPTIDPGFIAHLPVSASLATIDARLLPENATIPVARLMKALLPRRCRLIVKNVASASMNLALIQAGVSLIATADMGADATRP